MYLEKMIINHFRKFNENNNEIIFLNNDKIEEKIDISNFSTVVVGQNNAGKSTFLKAFDLLVSNGTFDSKDFNHDYLKQYLDSALLSKKDGEGNLICPFIRFDFTINFSDDTDENITPAISLMSISKALEKDSKGTLIVEIRLKDENDFRLFLEKQISDFNVLEKNEESIQTFKRNFLIDIRNKIDEIGLTIVYFNEQKKIDFKFSDLFNFKLVDALSVNDECVLSKQFKSILKYRFTKGDISATKEIDTEMKKLNEKIDELLAKSPSLFINEVMGSMVSSDKVQMQLCGSLSFESILDFNVNYFYNENDFTCPEDHFGLGYTKLVSIIASLLDYVERKPEKNLDSKISIIAIEEPETFMHPQLQKCFISNINDVLNKILTGTNKKIKCQLIISTHSPYIVSNKIELSNSINNINYFGLINNRTSITLLDDKMFESLHNTAFKNIKKHMSLNLSEVLFADAVILVEGFAEEKFIPYFLSNYESLRNKYVTIVNIRGSHGAIFEKLLTSLGIPSTIITDVDFKVSEESKELQIVNYKDQKTTNPTVKRFVGGDDLSKLTSCKIDIPDSPKLKVVIQQNENGFCGTSFEEAVILANFNKKIIIDSLIATHERLIKGILTFDEEGEILNFNDVKNNSKKIYNIISDSKAEFSLNLLKTIIESSEGINTPSYIKEAFDFLTSEVIRHA